MIENRLPEEETKQARVWTLVWGAVIAGTLVLGIGLVRPSMPDEVILLSGPRTGSYYELSMRLANDLRTHGLECRVKETGGSLDNLQQLSQSKDGRNVVALVPSILDEKTKAEASSLESLGSVAIEPLWLFGKADLNLERLSDLKGRTVVTEGENTTSHQIATRLMEQSGLLDEVTVIPIGGKTGLQVVNRFSQGNIDAVFLSGPAGSTAVQTLIKKPSVTMWPMDRGKAYAKRIKGATLIMAPEGVFDLARNVPPQDTSLLAGATCLVATDSLHPSLVSELLSGVSRVSRENASLVTSERFPSSQHVPVPLASSAQRFYQEGQVGLAKVLPYKVVRYLNHLGFFVLPLLTIAFVLLKALPMGLRFYGGMKLKAGFRRLEAVEKEVAGGGDRAKLIAELDQLDQDTAKMFVPRSIVAEYIDFRQFVHDMRDRVEAKTH